MEELVSTSMVNSLFFLVITVNNVQLKDKHRTSTGNVILAHIHRLLKQNQSACVGGWWQVHMLFIRVTHWVCPMISASECPEFANCICLA